MISRGGGLAVYIKQNIKFEKVDLALCGGTEVLCIKIVAANSRFFLVHVYNAPCIASTDVSCNFEKLLDANNFRKPTVFIGDFKIDWSGNSLNKENLETFLRLNQYEQLVEEHNRCLKNSKTIIDSIFPNA